MRAILGMIAAVALCAGTAGCMANIEGPLSSTFGDAVASMDNHIIDPRPAQGLPETSGARAVRGIERYEQGRVIQPVSSYTEQIISNSEGEGGGEGEDSGEGGAESPK